MKKFLVALLFWPMLVWGQVYPQQQVANGTVYARIINNTQYTISCVIEDQHQFFQFIIYPYSPGRWYPVFSQWVWQCR